MTQSFTDFVSRGQQSLYQSPQNEIAKLLAQVKQGGSNGQIALRKLRSIPGGIEALQADSRLRNIYGAPPAPSAPSARPQVAQPTQAVDVQPPAPPRSTNLIGQTIGRYIGPVAREVGRGTGAFGRWVSGTSQSVVGTPGEVRDPLTGETFNAIENLQKGPQGLPTAEEIYKQVEETGDDLRTDYKGNPRPQAEQDLYIVKKQLESIGHDTTIPGRTVEEQVEKARIRLQSAFDVSPTTGQTRGEQAIRGGSNTAVLLQIFPGLPLTTAFGMGELLGGLIVGQGARKISEATGIGDPAQFEKWGTLGGSFLGMTPKNPASVLRQADELAGLRAAGRPIQGAPGLKSTLGLDLAGDELSQIARAGQAIGRPVISKVRKVTAPAVTRAANPIVRQMQKTASEMEGLDLRAIGDDKPVPAAERRQLKGVNEGQIELARGISVPIDDPRIAPSSVQSRQTFHHIAPAGTSIRYETRAGGTRRGVIGSNGEIIPVSNNSPLVGRLNINMIEGSRQQGLEAENLRKLIQEQTQQQEEFAQSSFGKSWNELSADQRVVLRESPELKETDDLIAELSEVVSLRQEQIDSNKAFLDIEDAHTSTDLGKISRGKRTFIDRIRLEVSKGKLDPEVGSTADAFVRSLPDELLKTLGTSFFKLFLDDPRILAGYPAGTTSVGSPIVSGRVTGWYDSGNALLNIPVNILKSSNFEHQLRVIPHEVAHHLMQFVPKKDLAVLEKVYKRNLRLEKIKDLSGRRIVLTRKGFVTNPREYRYESFPEYFAEVIADKVVRDTFEKSLNSNAERMAFAKVMDVVKQLAIAAYNLLIRNGKGDEAERIYRNLILGEYSPAVKNRMLGRSKVAGQADAAARGAGGVEGTLDEFYPLVGDTVDGRTTSTKVDNFDSVSSTYSSFEEVPGIREMDLRPWGDEGGFVTRSDIEQVDELAKAIRESNHIDPVIIGVGKNGEPVVIEGAHRIAAMQKLGANSIPVKLVVDTTDASLDEVATAIRGTEEAWKGRTALVDPPTTPARQLPMGLVGDQQQRGIEVAGRAYSAAERKRLTPNVVRQAQGDFFWESKLADPVDNTVDVAKSAELTPDVAGDLPPIIPKPPVAEGAFSTPIGNGKNRPFLESLQDTEIQYNVAFADNLFRKIGEALSPISKYFDPSLAAPESSIGKRLVIVLANLMEEGRVKADRAYTYISRLGTRESIFGPVDEQFKFTEGPFAGRSLNDIVENRADPDVIRLLEEIKLKEINSETGQPFTALDYVTRLAELDEAGSSFARSYGAEVGFSPEDKVLFASRKVYGKLDSEGNVTQIAFDSGDFPSGFVKGQLEEARVYETAREAEAEGFILIPYDETVKLKIAAVYRLAAEESVSKYVFDNYEFKKIPASKRSFEEKQHELFRGVVGTSQDARALADDFKKAQAAHLKKAPESALARAAQGYIQLGRSYELAGDASLFTIQLLFAIMRDLYYPVYKGRVSIPGMLGMKTGKQFAKDFVIGLGSPERVRRMSAATIDDARNKLAGSRVIMFQMPGDRTEILEGVGKVEQISNWLEGTARSIPVIGRAIAPIAKTLTFPVRRFADAAAEAFGATQNMAALHLWDAFSPLAKKADGSFDPKKLQDVEDTINSLRGLSSSARLGISPQQRWWESMVLLAPRYRKAVLNLYKNAMQGGVRGDVARQSLISGFVGLHLTFAALLIAKNKSEGKKWDKDLQESLTPGSSKYFVVQAGDAVLGFGGKTLSDIRFMAKMLDPNRSSEQHLTDIGRWVRGQTSFLGQDVFTGVQGRTFEGDPVAPWARKQLGQDQGGWLSAGEWLPNLGKYLAKKTMFIWMQEAALGSSSVETKLKVGGVEFIGGRAYEAGKPQLFDEKANEFFGKPYAELNMLERHQLKTSSDVAEQLYEYDLLSAKRGNAYAAYIVTNNAARNDTQRRTKTALDEFVKNMLDPEQVHTIRENGTRGHFNGVYSILSNLRTAVRDAEDEQYISMKEYRKNNGINNYVGKEPTNDFDRMLNAWYDLYEKYEKPAGGLQWDEYNDRTGAKVPGLESAQEAFIKNLSPQLAADLKTWRERYAEVPGVQEILDLPFTKRIDKNGKEVSLRYGYLNNAIWNVIQNEAGYSSKDYASAARGNYGPGETQSYKGQPLPPPLSIYGKPIIKQPAGELAQ